MKKIILGIAVLTILVGGYVFYQSENADRITTSAAYYQELAQECEQKDSKSCCIASVKRMEETNSYRVSAHEVCDYGYEKEAMKCVDSFTWCEKMIINEAGNEDFIPVPIGVPTINLGPGFDSDGNGPICTSDAKGCPDGSFVRRTGSKCEFAKCSGFKPKPDFVPTKDNPIQLPDNVISEKDCATAGGEVWNTLGETSYNGELIGRVDGLRCPCACLVRGESSDILQVNVNGNIEEFIGNVEDIKTFDDCKKAGFAITDDIPATCTVGEPHMTGGKYKTFTNIQIETGKRCVDYTYGNCPGSCTAKCTPSSCGESWIEGGEEMRNCTADCDGAGSCTSRK